VGNPNKWLITGGGAPMYSLDKGLSWQYFPNGSGIAAVKAYFPGISRHDANRVYIPASDIGSAIVTDGGSSGQATLSSHKSFTGLHGTFRILEGPNTQNLVLAGVDQGANTTLILKSANGGTSWTPVPQAGNGLPLSRDGITKAVMSFADANDFLVVLASGTGQAGEVAPGTTNPGVWRTTNGGASFTQVNDLPKTGLSTGHRYDPQSCFIERDAVQADVRYFVSRSSAFYRSTNGGTNWTARTHPFNQQAWVWDMCADPVRGDNLWAVGDYVGVKVSRDGGQSWNSTAQYINARLVASCNGKVAVFGKKEGDTEPRLYYSSDDGATFKALTDANRNFHGVQGLAVDRNGKVWVSWNSVTVVTPEATTVPVTGVTVTPTTAALAVGATKTLAASVAPSTADQAVTWTSSATGVATVSSSGVVTGVSAGTATITATSVADKSKTATATITVTAASTDNLGFENDFTSWYTYGTASIKSTTAANVHSGAKSGFFSNGGGNYTVTGLTPGATYSLRGWVKAVRGADIWITLNNYGGTQKGAQLTSTSWTQSGDIVFTMGSTNTSVQISAWTGSTSSAYFDDYTVTPYTASTTMVDRTDPVGSGTITARGENGTNEGKAKAFDNDANTKWLDFSSTSWLQHRFGSGAKYAVSKYTITSGNDAVERDPRDWKLYGTNAANPVFPADYTQVDARSGVSFTGRNQKLEFTPSSSATEYSTYRLEISANKGAGTSSAVNIIQLSEVELFASASASCTDCFIVSSVLASSPQMERLTLNLHPNPASREVTIDLAGFEREAAVQVKVTDMAGKLFLNQQVRPRVAGSQATLSVGQLPQGLFVVTVQGSKLSKTAKLVIAK
jgi:hypothetical protein